MTLAKCESVAWQKVLVTVGVVTLVTSFVFADSSKIAKDLRKRSPSGEVTVIVQFTKTPTLKQHQKVSGKGGKLEEGTRACKSSLLFHSCFPIGIVSSRPRRGLHLARTPAFQYRRSAHRRPSSTITPKPSMRPWHGHRA